MDSFVLVGKAKTVFRLLELKLKYEELLRQRDTQGHGKLDTDKKAK